jgi:hypothetical protein
MSQAVTTNKTIDGMEFVMFFIPPRDSNKLLTKVLHMVEPAIKALIPDTKGASEVELSVPPEKILAAVVTAITSLDGPIVDEVVEKFATYTSVNGKSLHDEASFNEVFSGSLDTMYKWIYWGAYTQWGKLLSFASEGAGLVGTSQAVAMPTITKPSL